MVTWTGKEKAESFLLQNDSARYSEQNRSGFPVPILT